MITPRTSLALFLVLLSAAASPMIASAQTRVPTVEELQQDLDAGKFQDVIRKANQLTQARGAAAANVDKGKALALKAEAHLQLKQSNPAGEAFNQAAKEATDPKLKQEYTVMATLLKRSPGGMYAPKQAAGPARSATRPAPISVIDPESRKLALAALFEDEYRVAAPKIEQLSRATSLPPLLSGMQQAVDLQTMETMGTGADTKSSALLGSLTGKAQEIMNSAVTEMGSEVKKISTAANKSSSQTRNLRSGGQQLYVQKRGLISTEVTQLREIAETCGQIALVCSELSKSIKNGGTALAAVGTKAQQVQTQAEQTLEADYGESSSPVEGGQIVVPRPYPQGNPQQQPGGRGF